MKRILNILSFALLLGGCSSFLEEYSQDLAKIESVEDLDEILLGEAYLPFSTVKDLGNHNGYAIENPRFQCIHYMADELSKFIPHNDNDFAGLQSSMFGWHTWQSVVGLTYEKDKYVTESQDWEQAYLSINACNSLLSEAGKLTPANEREALEIERVKGEAAFLRALYYFELVNLYGKPYCSANLAAPAIPLKLSVMVEDRDYTCATVSEVYEQILKDLETAETSLAQTSVKSFPYRADITAVYLLKSRVLLYMQDWKNALEYADKTLKNKQELLDLTSFNGDEVLGESSPETIFSMGGYVMAYSIHPIRGMKDKVWKNLPNYIISEDLLQAFEEEGENDLRSRHYICKDTLGSLEVPYVEAWIFRKVRGWENASTRNISDNFLFRTAEAYLNGAEAAALAGDEATARTLLKKLRDKRLQSSGAITESGQQLADLIRLERQRELCLEGHRWFDLRRYSVREKYPYSKTITHSYTKYEMQGGLGVVKPVESKGYTLQENDLAYTLALPREVLDFQPTLANNFRPERPGMSYTPPVFPGVTPPGGVVEPDPKDSPIYKAGYEFGMEQCWELQGEGSLYDLYDQSPYESYSDDWSLWCEGVEDGWNDSLEYL
jgi:ragB/susD domain protein